MKRTRLALAVLLCISLAALPVASQQTKIYNQGGAVILAEADVLASAARTASGDSGATLDLGQFVAGNIFIDVTAVSGTTPSMTVTFQSCSSAAIADCYDHTSGAAITAAGKQLLKVNNFGRYVLLKFAISGTTPSFTFSVKAAFKQAT